MEFVLVRIEDLPAITDAARLGDAVSKALLHAVQTFEAGCTGKECLICERRFGIEIKPAAFWTGDGLAIGLCDGCARQSDRKLRRRLQKYSLEI
jgi:hypothetical protein